jgi:Fe-S cluster assembly iron-binding protein IscA
MLRVTETACEHLAGILSAENAPEDLAARLFVGDRGVFGDEGLKLTVDDVRPDDTTFKHVDRTVLVLDPVAKEYLVGKTLDVERTASGQLLAFIPA